MFSPKSLLATLAIFTGAAIATNGDATWFYPGLGACGANSVSTDYVVALNPSAYAGGANCWKPVQVNYQGRSVTVTVVDLCPGCGSTGVDLSPSAFQALASLDVGRMGVEWHFV